MFTAYKNAKIIEAYKDVLLNERLITEAFKASDMEKVSNLIAKSLSKQTGLKLSSIPGYEKFKSQNAPNGSYGIRYIIDGTTNAVRFNFDNKNNVVSADYWGNNGSKHPQIHIDTYQVSIAKIIPFVADQIKSPKFGNYYIDIKTGNYSEKIEDLFNESILEAKGAIEMGGVSYPSKKAAAASMFNNGASKKDVQKALGVSATYVNNVWKEFGNVGTVQVMKGVKEIPVVTPEEQKAYEIFKKRQEASPEIIFEDLKTLIEMVVDNIQPSLIITGMAGIGKTYTVVQMLGMTGLIKDKDYIHIKGASTAAGLYRALFINRQAEKMIVFDDCDDVLTDKQAVNILKGALDSGEVREVSWMSATAFNAIGLSDDEIQAEFDEHDGKKFPNQFQVKSRIIFISNLSKEKFNKAILSRSFSIDIELAAKDVVKRMKTIKDKILPKLSISSEARDEVIEYLEEEGMFMGSPDDPVNIRTFEKALRIRSKGKPNWKDLIARYA